MALTTTELEKYFFKYEKFRGVFAIDRLPFELFPKPFGIIINLDPSWRPGSHWTAIFFPEIGSAIYFDSFGRQPSSMLTIYLERNSPRAGFQYNQYVYQGDLSIKCGYYCLLFLESCFNNEIFPLMKCKHLFNESIINQFYY